MKAITIRQVDADLARALECETKQRGSSLNQTVLDLLRRALGLSEQPRSNGLRKHAGNWSEREFQAFERTTAEFGAIDEDLWK